MTRILRRLLCGVLVAAMILGTLAVVDRWARPTGTTGVTLRLLRSEPMLFLVTRRGTTQVLVTHRDIRWWGDWHGVLWATVSWRWGVDLEALGPAALRRRGRCLIVRLPEPRMLDLGIEPGSIGLLSKATALARAEDILADGRHRRAMEEALHAAAVDFARTHGQLETRDQIVARLNRLTVLIGQADRLRFE